METKKKNDERKAGKRDNRSLKTINVRDKSGKSLFMVTSIRLFNVFFSFHRQNHRKHV